jgi:hypothetical protein
LRITRVQSDGSIDFWGRSESNYLSTSWIFQAYTNLCADTKVHFGSAVTNALMNEPRFELRCQSERFQSGDQLDTSYSHVKPTREILCSLLLLESSIPQDRSIQLVIYLYIY